MVVYTIGFTRKSAAAFFEALRSAAVSIVLDVRVSNTSQLAGFAKRDDLRYFVQELLSGRYVHEPLLAPTESLLKAYRSKEIRWPEYEARFLELMRSRSVESVLDAQLLPGPTVF